MAKRLKKRWGYPVLVTCSLVMGLSLWLHYSVSDAADSYDVVAKKILEAGLKAQSKAKAETGKYLSHAPEIATALRAIHRGPYLVFLNPGCETSLEDSRVIAPPDALSSPRLAELIAISKTHYKELEASTASIHVCPKPDQGYQLFIAAFERKKGQWDVWMTDAKDAKESPKHLQIVKLPATRAHRIKQIAIVLLVLGAVGLVSLLIPRFLDRFYIRHEDPNVNLAVADPYDD